jgi:uncharacterized protein (TIGR02118 family)
MKKLIVMYKAPVDSAAFTEYYRHTHLPLVTKIPGLLHTQVTMIDRTLMGDEGNYMLVEMHFKDTDSFKAAMRSAENAATGADLANFASGLVTVMTGTAVEL